MKLLIVLVDKKQKNLGGQERRWLRVVTQLAKDEEIDFDFTINESSHLLSRLTDSIAPPGGIVIKEKNGRAFDYISKNINLIWLASKYGHLHISNQSIYLIPAILFIKLVQRKRVTVSYNGTSLDIHKTKTPFSYYNKVLLIHKISDQTEILNPRLLEEQWLDQAKTWIAPCSFSDSSLFNPGAKAKKIVFAGHFYGGKGIATLKAILASSKGRGYSIHVYGDAIPDDDSSTAFKRWLEQFSKDNPHISARHLNNMAGVYEDASVFLSLQSPSNYPSQSVLEALYSGCAVLMTNTGDSYRFGAYDFITYIDSTSSPDSIWNAIEGLHSISLKQSTRISEISKIDHSVEKYVSFIKDFLK